MTKYQNNMFTSFAMGWAAGIGFASFVNGNWICGIVCTILALTNLPYFIKGWKNGN